MYLCYSNLLLIVKISKGVTNIYCKSTFSTHRVRNFPWSRSFEFMSRNFRFFWRRDFRENKSKQTDKPGAHVLWPWMLLLHRHLEPRDKRMLTLGSQFEMFFPYCVRSEIDDFRGIHCCSLVYTVNEEKMEQGRNKYILIQQIIDSIHGYTESLWQLFSYKWWIKNHKLL